MPNIEEWMKMFRERWIAKDIDGVIELFTDEVDYFETPYQEIEDLEALREEWKSIRNQEDIDLNYEIYSRDGTKFSVK
jgi:ketosteroid isomerase-like protein